MKLTQMHYDWALYKVNKNHYSEVLVTQVVYTNGCGDNNFVGSSSLTWVWFKVKNKIFNLYDFADITV